MVVDGKWQAVGSDRNEVERALGAARRSHDDVPVTLTVERGRAQITFGPGADGVAAAVLLVGFDRRQVTAVPRGENSGRTLAHVDVVRGIAEVARFDGRAGAIDTPIPSPGDRVAAIVQAGDGRILGVAVSDAEGRAH